MTKLICIEGIDCSGKTTIGKRLAKELGWRYDHEPTFTSEEADKLNFNAMNPWQREYFFLKDRIRHQLILNDHDHILDSYILRGMVYAYTFSGTHFQNQLLEMCKSIYLMPDQFKQPDLTIFINQDPSYALELNKSREGTDAFNPKLTFDILHNLKTKYMQLIYEFPSNFTVVPIEDDLESTYQLVKIHVLSFLNRSKNEEQNVG